MRGGIVKSTLIVLSGLACMAVPASRVEAGGRSHKRGPVVPTSVRHMTTRAVAASSGSLGSGFVSTPYITVRGNGTAGGGYSPLCQFGDATMVMYGPLSAFRTTSAPVVTYTRGYDGRLYGGAGTSFSTPNQPRLSPVVYPTQAVNHYGFRQSGSPPWWQNGINWLDQN